jgi:hypothetical protein
MPSTPPKALVDAVAKSLVMNDGWLADAAARCDALAPKERAALEKNLDALVKADATHSGVAQALVLYGEQLASFVDEIAARRDGPGNVAMQVAGVIVLHGLVADAAKAVKSDADAANLLRAVRKHPNLDERDRGLLLDEIEEGLGFDRYDRAMDLLGL